MNNRTVIWAGLASVAVLATAVAATHAGNGNTSLLSRQAVGFQIGGTLVASSTGLPLPGKVVVSQVSEDGSATIVPATVGDNGDFVFRSLRTGPATIVGVAQGYGHVVHAMYVEVGVPQEIILSLPKGATVEGLVRDSAQRPVEGAEVRIEYSRRMGSRYMKDGEVEGPRHPSERLLFYEGSWASYLDDPLTGVGAFRLRNIQPNREFDVVAYHPELGVARHGPFTLDEAGTIVNLEVVLR